MTDMQTSLFPEDITRKKIGEVAESRAVFDKFIAPNLASMKMKVLRLAGDHPKGITLSSVMRAAPAGCGMKVQTASGRLADLKKEGLIEKTGKRRGHCAIHTITDLGRKVLREAAN